MIDWSCDHRGWVALLKAYPTMTSSNETMPNGDGDVDDVDSDASDSDKCCWRQ